MAFGPEDILRPRGDIPVELFPPEEDPEETVGEYISDAQHRTSGLDAAIKDTAQKAWVRYRAYSAGYQYALTQPMTADLAQQGAASYIIGQADRLLALATSAKAEYDGLTEQVIDASRNPYGPTKNEYYF